MKDWLKKFKNIRPLTMILLCLAVLAYPLIRAGIQGRDAYNFFRLFSDSLFIVSCVLLIIGIAYSFFLKGDFDISAYVFHRGFGNVKPYEAYKADKDAEHAGGFNYPLFLGVCGFLVSCVIALIL